MNHDDSNHREPYGGAETTEASPLLDEGNERSGADAYRRRVIIVTFAMFFFLEFGAGLFIPAQTAALEQKICDKIYSNIDPLDRDCKAPDVQGELADLQGWRTTLDCVPSLVATIPYGIISNKWGRHRVLSLAFSGITLGLAFQLMVLYFDFFPVKLVLVSPMFMFLGGGPAVLTAMLYTTIADITSVSARAPIFFQLAALFILSEVASGPLAGLVLLKSVWGLIALASVFYVLATATTFLLPDTLHLSKAALDEDIDDANDAAARTSTSDDSILQGSIRQVREGGREIRSFLSGHGLVIIFMFCYVLVAVSKVVQIMLLQYATKRYNWSWSKASFLLTIRSAVSLVVLILILPALTQLLTTRFKVSVIRRDVWVARLTGLAGVLGALLIALASTPEILISGLTTFAIHGGMTAVLRSLLSNMVEHRYLGTMNSLLGILEMLGLMAGAPALFSSLRRGFELGGDLIGLPFICAAAMIALSTCVIWLLPVRDGKEHDEVCNENGA
ncbi:hypothetical protein PFICI_14503 [Pestalotiopsis fici W106-1]|uniref:Major facilitator superfamily (MFS) profile domain-containing protein n=1 Tax=Pestalotiopsis fici (strain W106-1 / CGMCC3.15140) TaxID=1229662 RepID=W3WK70_PESFW|nr:uncharacterized protein PFICI_14503 [Pestalotiopsis fici W106-1]ETS73557.1 hypothetical protein PFICI_14503 [Pestalotiopsis fici W106-1]